VPYKDPEDQRAYWKEKRQDPEWVAAKKTYAHQYYKLHKNEAIRQRAIRYALNKEYILKQNTSYRIKNREKILKQKREYNRARRKNFPEIVHAYNKAWIQSHPEVVTEKNHRRRALKNNAPTNDLSKRQWQEILAAYGYRCAYCDKKSKKLEQDHITALSRGGSNTASNVIPACRDCNTKKGTKPAPRLVQPMLLTLAPARKKKA